MVQIEPHKHPQVLLVGNGLNRGCGADSWEKLLEEIEGEQEAPLRSDCPYPLRATLATNGQVAEWVKAHTDDLFGRSNHDLTQLLQALLSLKFDDILTTNYSYEIEATAHGNDSVDKAFLKKTCQNIEDGKRVDLKYLLHSCQIISFHGHENRIWHIHGETRKPDSIILGHYHYSRMLHRMIAFSEKRKDEYQRCQRKGTALTLKSRVDSFLLGDVYIIGFGMNFSEFDLWWLLERKNRERANHGKVFFYEPKSDEPNSKVELLKLFGVEVVHCGISNPTGTGDEKNKQYQQFYRKATEDIHHRIHAARGEE